jgi:hypothetical protein
MAKIKNRCDVPSCGRDIIPEDGAYPRGNQTRSLCSRCNANRYYWRKKRKADPRAVLKRKQTMAWWTSRLDWLFETRHGE